MCTICFSLPASYNNTNSKGKTAKKKLKGKTQMKRTNTRFSSQHVFFFRKHRNFIAKNHPLKLRTHKQNANRRKPDETTRESAPNWTFISKRSHLLTSTATGDDDNNASFRGSRIRPLLSQHLQVLLRLVGLFRGAAFHRSNIPAD